MHRLFHRDTESDRAVWRHEPAARRLRHIGAETVLLYLADLQRQEQRPADDWLSGLRPLSVYPPSGYPAEAFDQPSPTQLYSRER